MPRPVITLLTDFGLTDHYVATMKGVILGICPDANLVDISHLVPPFDIARAAYTLASAWQAFQPGTVHLVVVDPGVGGARRPIAMESQGHLFVGPDNGVLSFVADPDSKVVDITADRYFRHPVSHTFHGRDVFAPVAAWLASGVSVSEIGVDIIDFVRLTLPETLPAREGYWAGSVQAIDSFGNVITTFRSDLIANRKFTLRIGERSVSVVRSSYSAGGPDDVFVIAGSSGYLEVSLNGQNAAKTLGLQVGSHLQLILID